MNTRNRRYSMLLCAVFFLVASAHVFGQSSIQVESEAPINQFCPVMTEEPVDRDITTTYQGRTIAFCCDRCRRKFEANPERYAARLAAFGEEADDQPAAATSKTRPHETDAHDEQAHGEAAAHEDAEGHAGHEHGHAANASGLAALIAWLGRFHPPMVNFPIAMLVGAAVAEGLWMATKRQLFANAGRFCLWFGGLAAVMAGMLGWFFGGFQLTDESWVMTTHRWLGTVTVLWALGTLIVGERAYRDTTGTKRKPYRVMLFVGAAAVLVTGFFGGALIYGIDHYAWTG